jgi:hypothetical protein
MKARQLIDGAPFGPETRKVMGEAFDDAWTSIQDNFDDTPRLVDTARLKLAEAVLSVANEQSRDPQALKEAALQALARSYL